MEHNIPFVHYGQKAPCRDCQRRAEACHSTCEEYKAWRKRRDECIKSEWKRKKDNLNPRYVDKYF